jgi:hypothetical protein
MYAQAIERPVGYDHRRRHSRKSAYGPVTERHNGTHAPPPKRGLFFAQLKTYSFKTEPDK